MGMCPYPRRTETLSSPSEGRAGEEKTRMTENTNDCQAVRREAHSLKHLTRNAALILTFND